MSSVLPYVEEAFGILTDDNLYLDCILVKPRATSDETLHALRVWVPKYPLSKDSLITCARHQVKSAGATSQMAHLVFDLRSTGNSDPFAGELDFDLDLQAIAAWAKERFGPINLAFCGFPTLTHGRVYMWPLNNDAMMESYYYPPTGARLTQPCLLYLATYGNFTPADDQICAAFAQSGYAVYGIDPLRYLLHASVNHPLLPEDLEKDMVHLIQMLPSRPVMIAQPLAAGLGLMWSAKVPAIRGLISIGQAQSGLKPNHIFQNHNPHTYLLARYARRISPRPLALVLHEDHPLGGDEDELNMLMQSSLSPHRLERTSKLSASFLQELVRWIEETRR